MQMKDIVKYENYMNSIKFNGFTTVDFNFLIALCSKVKNLDTKEVVFTFDEIREITNHKITSKERFADELERMNKKLIQTVCTLKTETKRCMFVLFHTFETDLENCTLTVGVNEKYKFILNNLVKEFTQFELSEFVNLTSKYSKNLYRFLKQYKTTGVFYVSDIEEFKEKMCCCKNASTNKEFMRTILKPSIEELSPYFKGLKVEVKKAKKRGSPVVGYTFTFEAEKIKQKPITNGTLGQKATQKLKAQDKVQYTSKPVNHRFNQFPQREYSEQDYKDLEKRLINKSIGNRSEQEQEEEQERMRKFREKYPNLYK